MNDNDNHYDNKIETPVVSHGKNEKIDVLPVKPIVVPLSQKRDQLMNPFKSMYSYLFDNTSRKTYTLLSLTFIFISILAIFAIYPTINSISGIVKKIEEYKGIKTEQESKISNIIKLQQLTENPLANGGIAEQVQFFDSTFFPNDQVKDETIYTDLINKSNTAGTSIQSIKFQSVQTNETDLHIKTVKYQISLESLEKEKLQSFITLLKNSQHFYTIQRISLAAPATVLSGATSSLQTDNVYTTTITFVSYYYV